MKTANWGKTILAALLALTMVLPAVAGMAEGEATEVGDVKWLLAETDESGVFLEYEDKSGSHGLEGVSSGTITAGDVTNEDEDRKEAVFISSNAGDVSVTVKAVKSETDGAAISNNGGTVELAVNEVQAKEVGLYISSDVSEEGNKTPETTVTVAKDVHTAAEDLQPESEESLEIVGVEVYASGGKTAVEVAGEVSAEATAAEGKLYVYGVNASKSGESTETKTEITAGSAKATAAVEGGSVGNAEATAVQVSACAGQTIEVTVNGSAEAEATNKAERGMAEATAVQASACAGQTIEVTVNGSAEAEATNEAEYGGSAEAAALEAFADGEGSRIGYTVSGEITAEAKVTSDEAEAAAEAVRLEVSGGGAAALTAGGDITAAAEGKNSSAEAVKLNNGGGDISAEIVGNVTASGDGYNVGAVVQSTSSNEEGTTEKGNSDLTVTGDVSADIGVELAIDEVQTANITVDGTVEGETAGILLREDTKLSDDITMTVWEVKPNKDGAVVVREEIKEDELAYTEDKEAEKLIQYIIKVEDTSKDYITTVGTKAFTAGNGNEYQVANEGDKVLMKLNIPEGKELVDAFWDVEKNGRLLKDAEGNYYLEVPRGGGVLLSVTLKDAPKPEPEPQPEPKPEPQPEPQPEPKPQPEPEPQPEPKPEPQPEPQPEPKPEPQLEPQPEEKQEQQESKGTAQPAETKPYAYVPAPIVKVRDMEGRVEIEFYRDKRFIVKLENGEQEKGTFRTEDGILILKCEDETECRFDMGEGTVVYITRDGRNVHYSFHLKPDELEILQKLK